MEIQFLSLECKYKVFSMLNIFALFVNIYSLNHVTSQKNKCHQKIKINKCPNKVVQG